MRALLLDGPGRLRLGELPDPAPDPARLRLRVAAVGVCGSDLHYFKEGGIGDLVAREPLVLGHEFSAVVDDERGEALGWPSGTLVAVDPAEPCEECEWCRRDQPNLCPHQRFAGSAPEHGALRDHYWARPSALHALPAGFDAELGALLEPLGIAVHALDHARVRLGATVAVVGTGAIGLLLAQVARLAGASEVHALEPIAYRRELAGRLGCDSASATPEELLAATGGRGADVVLEATDSPDGPAAAASVARIGGRIVLVGIPDGDTLRLPASVARRKGLTVLFSRRMGHVYPRAIRLAESGRLDLRAIATHRLDLERAPEAFRLQAAREDGVIKSIVRVSPPSA